MKIPGYVTSQEAAQMLGISYQRVRILLHQGKLPSEKVGNTRLISIEAVQERLKANPQGGWPKGKTRKP